MTEGTSNVAKDGAQVDRDPWAEQLPLLMSLLDGLARRAVDDTNATSLGFLVHLRDIEDRVIAANRDTAAVLDKLRNISSDLEDYGRARAPLDGAVDQARTFLWQLGDRLRGSHEVMRSIRSRANRLQAELAAGGEDSAVPKAGLRPLVDGILADLHLGGLDRPDHVEAGLAGQDRLLDEVSATLENLFDDYAGMIRMKIDRTRAKQQSGAELEHAIREALASAQAGDIIRQQIELIADIILELRSVAENAGGPEAVAGMLSGLLAEISSRYVMQSQHEVHRGITGTRSPGGPEPGEDPPRFELF